jgi:hypothetical protein
MHDVQAIETTDSLPRFQRPIKSGGWAADMDPVKEKVH